MKQYDAIIIGFGKGGKTLAAELAKRNEKVAVIERSDEMYGGTCINIGCIPTKTLVHQAKLAPVKASWEEKKAYYAQAIAEKEEVTSFLHQKNYHNLADNPHTLSRIGLSEEEAVRKGLNIKVNKLPVAAIPRARTLGNTVGLFKVVVDVDTDQIVGCTLFGPESGEVINSVAMAMKTDQPYTFLRDFVFTHPSMSEALNDLMNF